LLFTGVMQLLKTRIFIRSTASFFLCLFQSFMFTMLIWVPYLHLFSQQTTQALIQAPWLLHFHCSHVVAESLCLSIWFFFIYCSLADTNMSYYLVYLFSFFFLLTEICRCESWLHAINSLQQRKQTFCVYTFTATMQKFIWDLYVSLFVYIHSLQPCRSSFGVFMSIHWPNAL